LPPRPIQRQHQLRPQALPQRLTPHQIPQFADELAGEPQRQISLQPILSPAT
jgi:hypothetical protein